MKSPSSAPPATAVSYRHRHRGSGIRRLAAAGPCRRRQRRRWSVLDWSPDDSKLLVRKYVSISEELSVRRRLELRTKARSRSVGLEGRDRGRQILARRAGRVFDFGPRRRIRHACATSICSPMTRPCISAPHPLGYRRVGDFARRTLSRVRQQRSGHRANSICWICARIRISRRRDCTRRASSIP